MCLGCGACAWACRSGAVTLVDVVNEGIRPRVDTARCRRCGECLAVCPGYETAHASADHPGAIAELAKGWGTVLDMWEGHAADESLRFLGSSGGAASMLARFCLENNLAGKVLHVGAHPREPWRNATVVSVSAEQLAERTGSRYAPASPCEALRAIEEDKSEERWVVLGKPCDIAALRRAQAIRPALSGRIACAISIFCAGAPSTQGTLDLLHQLGISPDDVRELRYRGRGWPGHTAVRLLDEPQLVALRTYAESWKALQRYRPYRCHLCPDGTGEFADIACGDPWYREPVEGETGSSLILARTPLGMRIVQSAVRDGFLVLQPAEPWKLRASQVNLFRKRSAVLGRLLALRFLGIPTPALRGFHLTRHWLRLPARDKAVSLFGTMRRALQRGFRTPLPPA
jgi:coenzyme F420 hydrogenase subunit beta